LIFIFIPIHKHYVGTSFQGNIESFYCTAKFFLAKAAKPCSDEALNIYKDSETMTSLWAITAMERNHGFTGSGKPGCMFYCEHQASEKG
jgi:hypothetical protein